MRFEGDFRKRGVIDGILYNSKNCDPLMALISLIGREGVFVLVECSAAGDAAVLERLRGCGSGGADTNERQ